MDGGMCGGRWRRRGKGWTQGCAGASTCNGAHKRGSSARSHLVSTATLAPATVMDTVEIGAIVVESESPLSDQVKAAVDAAVADLRAEVAELKASVGQGEAQAPTAPPKDAPPTKEAPESPYSFVMYMLLSHETSLADKFAAIFLICAITVPQILLCFAFADTSRLMRFQTTKPLYATLIPMGNFYTPLSVLENGTPTITAITAVLAILLLGLSIKNAIGRTATLAAHPMERRPSHVGVG